MKKTIALFAILIGVGIYLYITHNVGLSSYREESEKLAPPVGCPKVAVDKVFGEPEYYGPQIYNTELPYVPYSAIYKLKQVDGRDVELNVLFANDRVVKSFVYYFSDFDFIPEDNAAKDYMRDMKTVLKYRKAIDQNLEVYGRGLVEIRNPNWPKSSYDGQLKLPKCEFNALLGA